MNCNKVMLIGRAANVPAFFPGKTSKDNDCLKFNLATQHYKAKTATFIPINIWGALARAGRDNITKGMTLHIEGHISVSPFREGEKQYFSVDAEAVEYGSKPLKNQNIAAASAVDTQAANLEKNTSADNPMVIDLMTKQGLSREQAEEVYRDYISKPDLATETPW
jgi:single-stranded DNA-binding protein